MSSETKNNFIIRPNSVFTNEEKQFILNNYAKMDTYEIVDILNKSYEQIKSYADYYKIKKIKKEIFTEEEKQFIKDNYPIMDTNIIAEKLNKPSTQVKNFANNNQIKKINIGLFNENERQFITKNYPKMDTLEIANLLNKTVEQIRGYAQYCGIQKESNSIFSDLEKQFIISNYATMNTDEIALKLNKTYNQIRSFANKLNIYKENRKGSLTKKQKQFLIDNYSEMNIDDIVKTLELDRNKIINNANRMGLKQKDIYFTEFEKQFIIDNYSDMGSLKIAEILQKDIKKISAFAHNKGLKLNKDYLDGTQIIDLRGQKFNQLTVIELDYKRREEESIRVKNGEINQVSTYWLCKCNCGNENLVSVEGYSLTHNKTKSCGCTRWVNSVIASQNRFEKSFYNWCIENNANIYLDLWDYDLNDKNPNEISCNSNQIMYFKCPVSLHESEPREIRNIIRHKNKNYNYRCTKCNSFAFWGINNVSLNFLEEYWDYDKNTLNPWEIGFGCTKKIWIKCNNPKKQYHGSYEGRADGFKAGNRCPFCKNQKIHKLDSLGSIYPEVLNIWSGKNDKTPYEIAPKARKKYWFKCENHIHKDYQKAIYSGAEYGFQCPECNTSKGEKRVSEILTQYNIEYIPQHEYDGLIGVNGGSLRLDFYIPHANMAVEYDGEGHYMVIDFDGEGEESAKEKFRILKIHDKIKNEYCKKHKIKMLRIPYWDFDNVEEILKRELKLN